MLTSYKHQLEDDTIVWQDGPAACGTWFNPRKCFHTVMLGLLP
jgi:hypothetical protein